MSAQEQPRSTGEVVESHLRLREEGDLEADLAANYAPDVVVLTGAGTYHGHDGVRASARELAHYMGRGPYRYGELLVEGRMAFVVWSADGSRGDIHDGADSFLVEDGFIRFQAIHYASDRNASDGEGS